MDILFEEVQGSCKQQTQSFFKAMLVIFSICLTVNFIIQKGEVTVMTMALITGLVVLALISIFLSNRLITQIRKDGIYVRFPPFQSSFTIYAWNNIREIYIRQYDALYEYGGWGIKTGAMGRAYMLSGNIGIQIIFKDDTKLLIGTHNPEEVTAILTKLGKFN